MSFSSILEKNKDIVNAANGEYHNASSILPFTALELKEVFNEEEMNQLGTFVEELNNATDENEKKEKLLIWIKDKGEVVLKLMKLAKLIS